MIRPKQTVTLRPFKAMDQDEAKTLIQAGLAEHYGYLDPTLNPDLNDISHSYANAIFMVGEQDGRIVATGALIPRSAGEAEIARMSVTSDLRRSGIGTQMLRKLCDEGKEAGYSRIILETTATWEDVIAFYQRFGFQITHYADGEFGREVYLALELA